MNILCVDDENGALTLVKTSVKSILPQANVYGFTVASEALDFSEITKPDVAFLDVQMPEISGLELAKLLKHINPRVNIIFVTGFDDYTLDAISMRASGYLMKPVSERDIKQELDNLRNPVDEVSSHIVVRTFGQFEIFVDGKPLGFERNSIKELFAFLVDRRGAVATKKDIATAFYEDGIYSRSRQSYLSTLIKMLCSAVHKVGLDNLLIRTSHGLAVNTSAFSCDAYDYLDGNPKALNAFFGEYMSQYSWAEELMDKFYK